MKANSFFTIDVEEYYHICGINSVPPISQWDSIPSTVEENLMRLLQVFREHDVKTTCFFLGCIAKKHPSLVKEVMDMGHEIASHGFYHEVIYKMTRDQFRKDIKDTRHLLEDITGNEIIGYRSPSFSVTSAIPWYFDTLQETGYKYDSSVFPARRSDGGMKSLSLSPHWIETLAGRILEFPITVTPIMGKNICFFGGGYLRLFPKSIITHQADKLKQRGIPVLYYIHPREIDPRHPRLKMNPLKRFKSYVNLRTVKPKLEAILSNDSFTTLGEFYEKHATEKRTIYAE